MIHYSCDCCKRPLDPERDLRYVVKMEVYAAMDPTDDEIDGDRDHLQEIQDILQRMEDGEDEAVSDDVYQQLRYDMCSDCRTKFLSNPLPRDAAKQFIFSNN